MSRRQRQRAFAAALTAAASLCAAAPAPALELFGIRLWGRAAQDEFEAIDPVRYAVTFEVTGDGDRLEAALQEASALWTGRDEPVSGNAGLLARAKGDYRRILAALYFNAHYGGTISITLDGREAADLTLAAEFPEVVPVRVRVDAGPRFRFGEARIVNAPPPRLDPDGQPIVDPAIEAFRTGARANFGVIDAASAVSVERWRHIGHAKAREADRSALADHPTSRLDAVVTLDPGRKADFGRVTVRGSGAVDPAFVVYMADIPQGRHFDPDRIRAAEARLGRLGVFSSVQIEEAEEIGPDGDLDLTIAVEDRRRRTVGFGATLGTIEGLGIEGFFEQRNLFGRAERLRFEASVAGLGVTGDVGSFDYRAGVSFLKPGVLRPEVDFVAALTARRLDLDTYRETSVTARAGLQRSFARFLNGELSAYATKARYDDFFGRRDFLMFGATARGDYDRRDDRIEPTRGYMLGADVTPFYETKFGNAALRGTLEARGYIGLDANDRFVAAARAKVGSYVGPSDAESPPDMLFFAGGAGSVRGYPFRSIGIEVRDADGRRGTIGGRSLAEGSGELRVRINQRFGGVGFLDAGFVSATSGFGGADSDVRLGAGAGVRYYTGLGPLRLDVATPLNPRRDDPPVAVYIGIGQSF